MEPLTIGIIGFGGTMILAAARVPIALALAFVGAVGIIFLKGFSGFFYVLGTAPLQACNNYSLTQIPLFLLMGTFAAQGGMTYVLFRAANALIGHLRGGLAMATIAACAAFGAVCGSSLATTSSMGRIAVPEMLRYGYSPRLAAGSVAAGGTLGILIPPSLLMIVYSFLTETSVGKLFAAGVIPGLIATSLYITSIVVSTTLQPQLGPAGATTSWPDRFRLLKEVWGVFALFAVVIGGIYFGIFSPTEGAGIGAAGALVLGIAEKNLNWKVFVESVRHTTNFSAVVFLILIGISYFHFFMDSAEVPEAVSTVFTHLPLSPTLVMILVILFILGLGCVMDSIAIVFITTPFLFPIVTNLGYDPVWFGIIMVCVTEIGLVSPPFGINVFVIAAMDDRVSVVEAFKGVVPFMAADIVRIAIFLVFPQVVLWLPSFMSR